MLWSRSRNRWRLALEVLEDRAMLAPLVSGQEVTGYVVAGQSYTYELPAQAGQLVWVSLGETPDAGTSAECDIVVQDSLGNVLHTVLVVGASDFSIIAPDDGVLFINLSDRGSNEDLSYRMRAVVLPGTPVMLDDRDTPLYDGWEYDSFLILGSFNIHPFSTTAGSVVEVGVAELPTGNVSGSRPELYIVGPSNTVIAFDDGSSTATVEFTATAAGPYYAVVMDSGNTDPLYYSIYAFGVTEDPGLAGDYNGDDFVDEDDLLVWQASFGATTGEALAADGNGDGVVDIADYTIWRDNFEASAALQPAVATYELVAPLALSVEVPGFGDIDSATAVAEDSQSPAIQLVTPPVIESLSKLAKRDLRSTTLTELRAIDEALAAATDDLYSAVTIDWSV